MPLLVGSQKTQLSTEPGGQQNGSSTPTGHPLAARTWWGLLSAHLPSARGQAHAWPRMKFSSDSSGPASPEPASHRLSRPGCVSACLSWKGVDHSCGALPSSLRSGCWSQPQHSAVQTELLSTNCSVPGVGHTTNCPPHGVLTTTFKRGSVLAISQMRKLRPRESRSLTCPRSHS